MGLPLSGFSSSLDRNFSLERLRSRREPWDMVVIGGGATGVGIAVDAASRGYSVALLEAADFGKGTSSRSTKLIHGGVRYLAQGNVSLVREALYERAVLLRNAPHLVHELGFVIPARSRAEAAWYRVGIGVYDTLAGTHRFGGSKWLSAGETQAYLPGLRRSGIRAGVLFYDGQFDDTRLLISLGRTAAGRGAVLINYAAVIGFVLSAEGAVQGVVARDVESGDELQIPARVVINATGAFSDRIRSLADPGARPRVAASRGSHLVVRRSFLPADNALLVPKTADGRVLFAIPWHGYTLLGTTDMEVPDAPMEPVPSEAEIEFILKTAGQYLASPPARSDVLSAFAGIRPLVRADGERTAELSRDHSIYTDASGLITIVGGKWTTYRRMAQDCVEIATRQAGLPQKPCVTASLRLVDWAESANSHGHLGMYGSDASGITELMREDSSLAGRIHPDFPYTGAEIVWAVRHEMARRLEDVLARRTRMLFLDARAAMDAASGAASIMAAHLGRDEAWISGQVAGFRELAARYLIAAR